MVLSGSFHGCKIDLVRGGQFRTISPLRCPRYFISEREDALLEISGHTSLGNEGVRNWHDGRSSNHFGTPGNGGIAKLSVGVAKARRWNRIGAYHALTANTAFICNKRCPCLVGGKKQPYVHTRTRPEIISYYSRAFPISTRGKSLSWLSVERGRKLIFIKRETKKCGTRYTYKNICLNLFKINKKKRLFFIENFTGEKECNKNNILV